MTGKLLTDRHLGFLSLTGDCTGSSESTLVEMAHFWKSHVTAHLVKVLDHQIVENDNIYNHVADNKLRSQPT